MRPPEFEASPLRGLQTQGGLIWIHAEADRLEAGGFDPLGGKLNDLEAGLFSCLKFVKIVSNMKKDSLFNLFILFFVISVFGAKVATPTVQFFLFFISIIFFIASLYGGLSIWTHAQSKAKQSQVSTPVTPLYFKGLFLFVISAVVLMPVLFMLYITFVDPPY